MLDVCQLFLKKYVALYLCKSFTYLLTSFPAKGKINYFKEEEQII